MNIRDISVTFTGVDDRTDLVEASALAYNFPIEFGILFSNKNKDARYPSYQCIKEIVNELRSPLAAHVCGEAAYFNDEKFTKTFGVTAGKFGRVQFNGRDLLSYLSKEPEDEFLSARKMIFQCKDFPLLPESYNSHEKNSYSGLNVLFDRSGGRGIFPTEKIVIPDSSAIGFGCAGGITPDNIKDFLANIEFAGEGRGKARFWIDMESGVRTNGWFDLKKVRSVCETIFG